MNHLQVSNLATFVQLFFVDHVLSIRSPFMDILFNVHTEKMMKICVSLVSDFEGKFAIIGRTVSPHPFCMAVRKAHGYILCF